MVFYLDSSLMFRIIFSVGLNPIFANCSSLLFDQLKDDSNSDRSSANALFKLFCFMAAASWCSKY